MVRKRKAPPISPARPTQTPKRRRTPKAAVDPESSSRPFSRFIGNAKKKSPRKPSDEPHEDQIGAGRSYFESHKGVVRTTNLTLASLTIAPPAQLEKSLANFKDPLEAEQKSLALQIQSHFSQFLYMLNASHSLLFYGYGSKKSSLDEFASYLTDTHAVIVVNGFNPTVSLRHVLSQIATEILQLHSFPKRTLLDYIDAIQTGMSDQKIALVIHNIDGVSLRASETQNALSLLSTLDHFSIIASIDHVNAPLLWDGATYSKYAWTWIRADTFMHYDAETVYSSKPLLRGGEERRVEGAIALLKSLSERARDVFRELANRQTGGTRDQDTANDVSQTRTTFNQLFETAKERFLASDPSTLRIILTELQTHDLLASRRGADAAEQLWIPLQNSQLEAVLAEVGPSK